MSGGVQTALGVAVGFGRFARLQYGDAILRTQGKGIVEHHQRNFLFRIAEDRVPQHRMGQVGSDQIKRRGEDVGLGGEFVEGLRFQPRGDDQGRDMEHVDRNDVVPVDPDVVVGDDDEYRILVIALFFGEFKKPSYGEVGVFDRVFDSVFWFAR